MSGLDKNSFDMALIQGGRASLSTSVALLRQAEQDTFNPLLDETGEFLVGVAYQRDCPLCAWPNHQAHQVMHVHGMHLMQCPQCKYIYSREVITPESERKRYESSAAASLHLQQKQTDIYARLESEKARYIAERMSQFVPKGKALEIGSSNGVLLDAAMAQGWDILGIELNASAVSLARTKEVSVIHGEYPAALPVTGQAFNAVVALDVLEHIADPLSFLSIVSSQLADPGYLIVQVPNFNSLLLQIEGAKNSNICHGHWSYFTPDTLSALLLKAGFEVCFLETYITELDRIQAYPENTVAAVYQQLSGKPLSSLQALNTDMLHDDYLGYKLFGIFRKINK